VASVIYERQINTDNLNGNTSGDDGRVRFNFILFFSAQATTIKEIISSMPLASLLAHMKNYPAQNSIRALFDVFPQHQCDILVHVCGRKNHSPQHQSYFTTTPDDMWSVSWNHFCSRQYFQVNYLIGFSKEAEHGRNGFHAL